MCFGYGDSFGFLATRVAFFVKVESSRFSFFFLGWMDGWMDGFLRAAWVEKAREGGWCLIYITCLLISGVSVDLGKSLEYGTELK